MKYHNSSPSIAEADIENLEQILQCTFPSDYRTFLLEINGGQPEHNLFRAPVPGSTGPIEIFVHYFLGIDKEDSDSDLLVNRSMLVDRIPRELLAIAHDGIGNVFCIGLSGDLRGKICIWLHDKSSKTKGTAGYPCINLLSNSFNDFRSKLVEDE